MENTSPLDGKCKNPCKSFFILQFQNIASYNSFHALFHAHSYKSIDRIFTKFIDVFFFFYSLMKLCNMYMYRTEKKAGTLQCWLVCCWYEHFKEDIILSRFFFRSSPFLEEERRGGKDDYEKLFYRPYIIVIIKSFK